MLKRLRGGGSHCHRARSSTLRRSQSSTPDNKRRTIAKTVWNRGTHRAGEYGSRMVTNVPRGAPVCIPQVPVRGCRHAAGSDRRAERERRFILDFFAGSGTTAPRHRALESGGRGHSPMHPCHQQRSQRGEVCR